MKILVLFLTLAVSTNAYDDVLTTYHHDPNDVLRPDGEEMIIDGWSVGATTSHGFRPNILNYQPVIVRKGNGLIRHVTSEELNRLLHDITFRIPGPRDDHVPYDEHYNVPALGGHYYPGSPPPLGGMPQAQYGNSPHAQIFGGSPHGQPHGGIPHEQQFSGGSHSEHGESPHSEHGGGMPGGFPGGMPGGHHGGPPGGFPGGMPGGQHGGPPGGFPGGMPGGQHGGPPGGFPGGMPGGAPHGEMPGRHISSGSRSNSELSIGSRGSRGSRGSLGSRSSRRAGDFPNMPPTGGGNGAHGGIPNVPRGSPHVQFAGSGSLEHYAESPQSQMSGASRGSGRSASGRNKSRLGAEGMPEGFPGGHPQGFPGGHPQGFPGGHPQGMPGGGPHGMPGGGPHGEMPGRHISSGSRSNSELSVGSRGSQGSEGSQGSRASRGSLGSRSSRRAGEMPNLQHPGGSRQPPEFPGGYPYEGSDAGSQDGYDSAGSGKSNKSAEAAKPAGEKKPKKNHINNLFKKLKIGSSKKSSST